MAPKEEGNRDDIPEDFDRVSLAKWMVRMEMRVAALQRDVTGIRSVGKWFATAVGGAVVIAVVTFITNGGLNGGG